MVNHTALKLNNGPYINESTQSLNYTSLLKSKNQVKFKFNKCLSYKESF